MDDWIKQHFDLSDRSVDLTVHHSEKGLHLERVNSDVVNKPLEEIRRLTERIDALENESKHERLDLIHQKLTESYSDRKAFAKAVFAKFPERKDFGKFCNHIVYPFLEGEKTRYYDVMQSMLALPEEAPESPVLVDLQRKRTDICRSIDPEILFIENFPLLWYYREGICNNPELANIDFIPALANKIYYNAPGFFIGGNIPRTLGEMLYLYNLGNLRDAEHCLYCGKEQLIYKISGSPFSGAGYRKVFCPYCGSMTTKERMAWRFKEFGTDEFQCPRENTPWTMVELVTALKERLSCELST